MAQTRLMKLWLFFGLMMLIPGILSGISRAQTTPCASSGSGVCTLTWQQDTNLPTGSACSGCSYRTGENLSESTLTASAIQGQNFGQLCSAPQLDGQVYAQPLVVTNVNWMGQGINYNVAYVVTQNDTIYAINATPTPGNSACSVLPSGSKSLLPSGQQATSCTNIGGGGCGTIAPKVGILGTPVIHVSGSSGTIYLVAFSEDSSGSVYHYLHALDISTLQEKPGSPVEVCQAGCGVNYPDGKTFSFFHIQRPGLLFVSGGTGGPANSTVYVAFSMMDGYSYPYPNGVVLAYDASTLAQTAFFQTSLGGENNSNGGGVWMGGAGLAYGTDGQGGGPYIYVTTANGTWDNTQNYWGDSFLKLDPITLADVDYFTPSDWCWRNCPTGGGNNIDADFGSGGVMLLPDDEVNPHYAISGDKEGGVWFMSRVNPGKCKTSGGVNCNPANCSCSPPVQDCTATPPGPSPEVQWVGGLANACSQSSHYIIHTNIAFWEQPTVPTEHHFIYVTPAYNGTTPLVRYELCPQNNPPVCGVGVQAQDESGTLINTLWGFTPAISAASSSDTAAVLWGIVKPDAALPAGTTHGVLYAIDAVTMKQLYASKNPCAKDAIAPATKFSVPTVANGYVYVGAQALDSNGNNNGLGTFYIFGLGRTGC